MPSVDLGAAECGIIKFSDGQEFWCPLVHTRGDPGEFAVRIESGWYRMFTRDGTRINPNSARSLNIIEFFPCGHDDPRARGLPGELTP